MNTARISYCPLPGEALQVIYCDRRIEQFYHRVARWCSLLVVFVHHLWSLLMEEQLFPEDHHYAPSFARKKEERLKRFEGEVQRCKLILSVVWI